MLKEEEVEWKEKILSNIHFVGDVTIDDDLEHVAPLLVLKAKNNKSIAKFKRVIADLVGKIEPNELFDWISVLNFSNEPELLSTASKMIDDKIFLESKNALWVLKMVH